MRMRVRICPEDMKPNWNRLASEAIFDGRNFLTFPRPMKWAPFTFNCRIRGFMNDRIPPKLFELPQDECRPLPESARKSAEQCPEDIHRLHCRDFFIHGKRRRIH